MKFNYLLILSNLFFVISTSSYASAESVCTIESRYDTYCAHNFVRADLPADDPRCLRVKSLLLGYDLYRDDEVLKFYRKYEDADKAAKKLDTREVCVYLN